MIKFLVNFGVFMLVPLLAFAGNSHEHFQLLPLAQNYLVAAPQIFSLEHKFQLLPALFEKYESLSLLLQDSGLTKDKIKKLISEDQFGTMTLTELCEKWGGDPKENLAKLLAVQSHNIADKVLARKVFVAVENLRRSLTLVLDTVSVVSIFEDYFEVEPYVDRDQIELSVSSLFF